MSQVARRYFDRGVKAIAANDLESALEALRAAVELAPQFGNARIAYAIALGKFGDAPRAAAVLRAGIGRATSRISAGAMWATLGDVLTLGGDFFGAEEAFRECAAVPGYQARAASGLARVYGKMGRHKDMASQLKIAARISASAPK